MVDANFPKYTEPKHKGNIGEAIAQYFLSKFCLVHKIDGSNDLGNDFICELVKDQAPTNLLFYVQVKFTQQKPKIKESTENYWKSSPIPVFVFWIKENKKPFPDDPEKIKHWISYLRMTPKLHHPIKHKLEKFKPYSDISFKRDLVVDYTRSEYEKGHALIVEPRDYLTINEKNMAGMGQYTLYVDDVIPEYKDKILKRSWVQNFVVAELLYNEHGSENNRKALQSIDLALSLISPDDQSVLSAYYDKMTRLRQKIINKLEAQNE